MRITKKYLLARVQRLNILMKVQSYALSQSYGGFSLHYVHGNTSCEDVSNCGHIPAKELDARIEGFIRGVWAEREVNA